MTGDKRVYVDRPTISLDGIVQPDGSTEYIVSIYTSTTDHHGRAASLPEALFNAASHWHAYTSERAALPDDWRDPDWTKADGFADWRWHVADVIRAAWSSLTETQRRAIARNALKSATQERRP